MSRAARLPLLPLAMGIAFVLDMRTAAAQQAADGSIEEAPYQDRVIDPDKLAPLPPDESAVYDNQGLPRSIRAELVASESEVGDERFGEQGLSFNGLWETERLGSLSFDGTIFHSNQDRQGDSRWLGSATLWQRGLAFDNGWLADNGLGVLNTGLTPLLRDQYRFFLPSVPFAGAGTDWHNATNGLQFMASAGRAGVFTGSRIIGFDKADGNVGSAAAQWNWAPGWRGAVAVLATDGQIVPDDGGGSVFEDGRTEAVLVGTGWSNDLHSADLNLHASDGYLGAAQGAWLDAQSLAGRYTFNYGAFRLDPDLAWGALPINNDAQGAYGRVTYNHARWNWNASLDAIDSISGNSFSGYYGNVFARYQARANLGYGGSLSLRDADDGTDYSTRLFADRNSRLGQSRLQLDYADGELTNRNWQLTFDQELPVRQGQHLSLSASYGSVSYDEAPPTDTWSLAAFGGLKLTDRLSLDGNFRVTHGQGTEAFRGTDMNISLNWRMAAHWWLSTTLYENNGKRRSPFALDPLAPPDQYFDLPRDRAIYLNIRYERQAGTSARVLGGTPGSAYGSINGSVFLDENGDGVRSASELTAANVTVVLDGNYSVRTDSEGNFEFPRVGTGSHSLEVVADNLPLPWFFDGPAATRRIEIKVRAHERVDFGAIRQR